MSPGPRPPPEAIDLTLIRNFRDQVLATTPRGRSIPDTFYKNSPELLHHFFADTNLQAVAKQAIGSLQPVMRDIMSGAGQMVVSSNQVSDVNALVRKLNEMGGVVLKAAIQEQLDRVGRTLTNLTGKTSTEARRMVLGIPTQIVNPRINTNGAIEFTVTGELTGTLRVKTSDDLIRWTVLTLPPVTALPAILSDNRPVTAKQRYYRIVISP